MVGKAPVCLALCALYSMISVSPHVLNMVEQEWARVFSGGWHGGG